MGKYFVTIARQQQHYKLCRDDINRVFSCKIQKLPKVPAFAKHQSFKEDDTTTLNEDSDPQFEPIQFFSCSSETDN